MIFGKYSDIIIIIKLIYEEIEMIDISAFIDKFMHALNENFGERVWFVGLQGSYGRGEATETSDIDIVVILDEFNASDIVAYNAMLDSLSPRELICGFISGKKEIFNWEPSDLFQFYYDTLPIKGSLDELLSLINDEDIDRAIKIGVCNIYHGCVHNMLHEKSNEILKSLYKSASFVVQGIYFKDNRNYIRHLNDLLHNVSDEERFIIETFIGMKNGDTVDFEAMSNKLFEWTKKRIVK